MRPRSAPRPDRLSPCLLCVLVLLCSGCDVGDLRFVSPTAHLQLGEADQQGVILAVQALTPAGHPATNTRREVEWIFTGRDLDVRALSESDWIGQCPTDEDNGVGDDDDSAGDDTSAAPASFDEQESTRVIVPVEDQLCFAHSSSRLRAIDCDCDDLPPNIVPAVSAVVVDAATWLQASEKTQLLGLAHLAGRGEATPRTFVIQE